MRLLLGMLPGRTDLAATCSWLLAPLRRRLLSGAMRVQGHPSGRSFSDPSVITANICANTSMCSAFFRKQEVVVREGNKAFLWP
jgi:hypothetical protein